MWSTWLPFWSFSYNNTVHSETKYTPFELVFGRHGSLPSNLKNTIDPIYNFDNYPIQLKYRIQRACDDARNNLIISKEKRKVRFDTNSKCVQFEPGSKVLLKSASNNKSDELFNGPYVVVKDTHPNIVIKVDNKQIEVHKNRVKLYRS